MNGISQGLRRWCYNQTKRYHRIAQYLGWLRNLCHSPLPAVRDRDVAVPIEAGGPARRDQAGRVVFLDDAGAAAALRRALRLMTSASSQPLPGPK